MANTVTVRRANVILDIDNDEAVIDKYLGMGYDLLGENGRIVQKATSGKDAATLQHEIEELQAENKRLRLQIKKLKENANTPAPAKPKNNKKNA